MRIFTTEELKDMTEIFVLVLQQNPHRVLENVNKHLENCPFKVIVQMKEPPPGEKSHTGRQ